MSRWGAAGARLQFLRQVSHYLIRYATWIPPLIWFNAYVAEVTFIRGPSMYPFLNPQYNESLKKDLCLVWKLYAHEGLRRGMVVTFRNPNDPNKVTVKRIVGLEGDVVRTKPPYPYQHVIVPEGHVWVEGDGELSKDSNYYGPISARLITGKITHILSPWDRAGRLRPLPGRRNPLSISLGAMVLGFQTANRTPSTVPTPTGSVPDLDPAALDHGHTDHAHILSHAIATGTESLRIHNNMRSQDGEVEGRPPYLHCMLAGGLGGSTGDMLMHSLDTVKTRQQGDPHIPPKYTSLGSSYLKIFRQEGFRRGLYGGWIPALAGSFPATCFFFGSYEWSKRQMLDYGVQPHLAYLLAGFIGDFAASIVYVPSEVVKTRLQLQGRHNNPFFTSGYNYRGTVDAVRTIVRTEGVSALFHGYGATLWRDLPFSALQFMFYEQGQSWAHRYKGSRDIGWHLELLTGAAAGGLAGTMTCPLDVVKTRLQTQVHPEAGGLGPTPTADTPATGTAKDGHMKTATETASRLQKRLISTSSPSTHTPKPGAVMLETSSMITGLRLIYKAEGVAGWFRGVGPRAAWTSIQSGCMLFLYQSILRKLEVYMPMERRELA
ncbi:mitochondrial carrier domain-containing protein [Chaetomium strumarium]|uniref:Mitochondrial carrier domain-containing protein n=1 Tax=Chaetomium strumarium TaxID=1170767 RepID=A0AAJ0M2X5_9PEZI|nr:mitochondrial carrier domain-containing protein [Chaetomium strumarium]